MKHLLFFFLSLLLLGELQAQQAEVSVARVILIGDGGELNKFLLTLPSLHLTANGGYTVITG